MLRMPENSNNSSSSILQHKTEELSMMSGYVSSNCGSNSSSSANSSGSNHSNKRPRTSEDFLRFCDVVLSYANYPGELPNHADFRPSNKYLTAPSRHHHKDEPNTNRINNRRSDESERGRALGGRKLQSPLNSVGESARGSTRSSTSSTHSDDDSSLDVDIETPEYDESWSMVTCWCGKPFAGRPMIECESCLVWLHLSCARVRKSNIPKHFKCARCKGRRLKSHPSPSSPPPLPPLPPSPSHGGIKRKEDSATEEDQPAHSNPSSPSS